MPNGTPTGFLDKKKTARIKYRRPLKKGRRHSNNCIIAICRYDYFPKRNSRYDLVKIKGLL